MKTFPDCRDALAVFFLIATAITTASGQESQEIRCRGGGFGFDTVGTKIASSGETILTMSLRFFNTSSWVQVEHLPGGYVRGGYERLIPPSCAWVSPGDGSYEPIGFGRAIRFETPANAQLKQRLHGSEVDTSPTAAERYPDARSIREYLRDPNHYWSFFITSFVRSEIAYYVAGGHGYFKPPVTLSPADFKARKSNRSITSTIEASGVATKDAVIGASDSTRATKSMDATSTQAATRTLDASSATSATVKAGARVTLPAATAKPTRHVCDLAREARARKSPAAPGLEAKCAAQRATQTQSR